MMDGMDTGSNPRAGGVKVVFDVRENDAGAASEHLLAFGFDVRPYYASPPARGGAAPGWLRLGAEQPMRVFSDAERDRLVAAFDEALDAGGFSCRRAGTDVWTAGGRSAGDAAGDRAPRRPRPRAGAGSAMIA